MLKSLLCQSSIATVICHLHGGCGSSTKKNFHFCNDYKVPIGLGFFYNAPGIFSIFFLSTVRYMLTSEKFNERVSHGLRICFISFACFNSEINKIIQILFALTM